MATEKRLIDSHEFWNRLSHVVYDIFTVHEKDGQLTGTASVGYYTETIEEVLKQTKTVDAVEVEDPELLKAIKLLIKQYAHSKASDYVHSPVAHALYHAWKQVDERRTDG